LTQQTGCTHLIHREVILDHGDALARSDPSGVWRGLDSEYLTAMAPEAVEPRAVVSADVKDEVALSDVSPQGDVSDDFSESRRKARAMFCTEEIVEITIVGLGEAWKEAVSASRTLVDLEGPDRQGMSLSL
jgi:hypothetical protein